MVHGNLVNDNSVCAAQVPVNELLDEEINAGRGFGRTDNPDGEHISRCGAMLRRVSGSITFPPGITVEGATPKRGG